MTNMDPPLSKEEGHVTKRHLLTQFGETDITTTPSVTTLTDNMNMGKPGAGNMRAAFMTLTLITCTVSAARADCLHDLGQF